MEKKGTTTKGDALTAKVKSFVARIEECDSLQALSGLTAEVEAFESLTVTSGIAVKGRYLTKAWALHEKMKADGAKITQTEVAEKLGMARSNLSRAFQAIKKLEPEEYLKQIQDEKITSDGRPRQVVKKANTEGKAASTPVTRAQKHIDNLKGVYMRASAAEQDEIRKYGVQELASVFRSVVEAAAAEPEAEVEAPEAARSAGGAEVVTVAPSSGAQA